MIQGLTQQAVEQRRRDGLGNESAAAPSRSYLHIIRKNVLTFVNIVLITIGVLLVILGSPSDALTTAGIMLMNILIGMVQEIRAKRKLDRIVLLTRPHVTVIRDSKQYAVDASELVLGDVVMVSPGDQIVCDGRVIGDGKIEVDESLLTGESDVIAKTQDDTVYSGSFCVSGSAFYETTQVGKDSLANKITAKARQFEISITPLQRHVNIVVRLVSIAAVILGIMALARAIQIDMPTVQRVQIAAVIMGTIPQGLIFLLTLTYALGATRLAGQGVLVQQINAVESLSNITVLCTDKTGTLTTNRIQFEETFSHSLEQDAFDQRLAEFVASASQNNRTGEAIFEALPGQKHPLADEVPFTSIRKWSGMIFDMPHLPGAYVLGAPEVIMPNLATTAPPLADKGATWVDRGLRVMLLAHDPTSVSLHMDEKPALPTTLEPLGLIALSDELRPEAQETLDAFTRVGIQIKIISGDNPQTVKALAAQVGFNSDKGAITGAALEQLDHTGFQQAVRDNAIFGRITPDQKERLIEAMRNNGDYVAMVGDGVNDVLALKKSHIGIAMYSGSAAARNVSDIVLLNDSFAALPSVFQEGQRIVNGILDTMRLLLTRTAYVALIIALAAILDVPFPFLPTQDALNSFLTAGLPPILLALWASSGQQPHKVLMTVSRFIFPAAGTIALLGITVFLIYLDSSGDDLETARSALITTVIFCGASLILFARPPHKFWAAIKAQSKDQRGFMLTAVVIGLLSLTITIPYSRDFFSLKLLAATDYLLIMGLAIGWVLVLRFVYRLVENSE